MRMEEKNEQANATEEFWLVFKLMKQNFAVNCKDVIGIFRLDEQLTQMSGYSSHVRGVMDFRGATIPLLELRSVMGMISFEQENAEFKSMIDARIDDHRNWVHELGRCVEDGDEFRLATDPHQCAFGKWYYNFKPNSQAIAFDLKKIEEPHARLHQLALHIEDHTSLQTPKEIEEKRKNVLREAEEEYMPKLVDLLKNMQDVFHEEYREMCIVVSNEEGRMIGLLVDAVQVVEQLVATDSQGLFATAFSSSCIRNTARGQNVQGEIFVLNRDDLFHQSI